MSKRKFDKGDKVICRESGVYGAVIKFYTPTACEEQTLIRTDDGRKYHAPTRIFDVCTNGLKPGKVYIDEFAFIGVDLATGPDRVTYLNAYNEHYISLLNLKSDTSLAKTYEKEMTQAYRNYYNGKYGRLL